MSVVSGHVIDLIDASAAARSPAAIGRAFFEALQRYGAKAIYARAYRPHDAAHETVLSRISPPGWESFYAEKRFAEVNYLEREVRRRAAPFRWSEIRLVSAAEQDLAQALVDNGFPDGLAIPRHGPGGTVGVTSLAFERLEEVSPAERAAIELAAIATYGRMDRPAPNTPLPVALSPRERDCLGFIASGYSDTEIADLLGIGTTTVVTYVKSARGKLGAKTRAQAVAQALIAGLI